ncbi:MAG: hypothetical protein QM541_10145 [Flavobacterium sp.]|nr:hypothetical protein [Flavobacterium sp.]
MGLVYADIELKNAEDITLAKRNSITEEDIKSVHVNMLVNTGAFNDGN